MSARGDLVLVGGGHSHVEVLRRLAADPVAGLRTTLISREMATPYSGMLPGYVAGHYALEAFHIDLVRLAAAAGARFITGSAEALALAAKTIQVPDRPPLRYDWLSINSGAAPATRDIEGADRVGIAVKPISRFVPKWLALLDRLRALDNQPFRLAIVGSGAGGVELALAIRYRLAVIEKIDHVEILIISAAERLLTGYNAGVRERMQKLLSDRRLDVHLAARVTAARPGVLVTDADGEIDVDEVLWVTQAAPQAWPGNAGLATDDAGFILVNDALQSISDPAVFAAGDIATMARHPRPKAGVFAVRQGPVLARNLRRAAAGARLRPYEPQHEFLSLISTGGRHAVAARGDFAGQGWWAWALKDWIDRRFMRRYTAVRRAPLLARRRIAAPVAAVARDVPAGAAKQMRLGVAPGMASISRPPANALTVMTTARVVLDVGDPWFVGRVAAEHALNDIWVTGGVPIRAMVRVTIPAAAPALEEADLQQALAGVRDAFDSAGVELAGFDHDRGDALALGFALLGSVHAAGQWRPRRIEADDALILTKATGTGVILTAMHSAVCTSDWWSAAAASMRESNRAAAAILRDAGVRAGAHTGGRGLLTGVTRLAGASHCALELYPARVLPLPGVPELLHDGVLDARQCANEAALREVGLGPYTPGEDDALRLICDPQLSGGLLAAVRPAHAVACVERLRDAGYACANVVGRAVAAHADMPGIRLVSA